MIIESTGKSILGLISLAEHYKNGFPITFTDTEYTTPKMETIIEDDEWPDDDEDIEDDEISEDELDDDFLDEDDDEEE